MQRYTTFLWSILILASILTLVFAIGAYSHVNREKPVLLDYTRTSTGVENALQAVLLEHGISSGDITHEQMRLASRDNQQWNYYYREINVMGDDDLLALERKIMRALAPWKVRLSSREAGSRDNKAYYKIRLSLPQGITTHSLLFFTPEIAYHPAEPEGVPMDEIPVPPRPGTPLEPLQVEEPWEKPARIAIILDDAGDNFQLAKQAVQIHPAVTLSILPKRPFSREISQLLDRMGLEYMLHQPMEAQNPLINPGWAALLTTMDEEEIRSTFTAALESLPGAAGINNHMGSRFTQDPDRLRIVMEMIAERDLYFIDSYTTSDSQAYAVATEFQVSSGFRDVFIDNESDVEAILRQLDILVRDAQRYGSAIGIGHVRSRTIEALEEFTGRLEEMNVELVTPSVIVSHRKPAQISEIVNEDTQSSPDEF